jgi:(4S)-4-hydroxy-5-phosphonooxypentane-2,3-dione isomerase
VSHFAIFVTVKLKPGNAEAFKPLILENAAAAVRDEPECHEFHVIQAEDDADTFHFFEVYTSAGSLDHHRETPHYKKYDVGSADMIAEKSIQRLSVLNHGNVEGLV